MENAVLWDCVIKYYEALMKEGFNYSLQLNLVKQIANSHYADLLYPSTSHFALVISSEEDYEERLDVPSIAVEQLDEYKFKVIYSPKQTQTHNISKKLLHHTEVWSYLESLFLKLKLNSEKIEII